MSFEKASQYVTDFISKYGDSTIKSKWNPAEFKKIFKKKEKNGIKKNKSAYMFFSDEERQNIKKEGLVLNNKQIVTELGSRWTVFKQKNPAGVERYNKMAEDDKVRYEKELSLYESSGSVEKTSRKKSNSLLKKNKSAYMFFCIEDRENIKKEGLNLNNKEVIIEMANRWKKLRETNPSKVEKYNKLAAEDKERYTREKNAESGVLVDEKPVEVPPPIIEAVAPSPPVPEKVKKVKKTKK
jgi:hypothetical protein